MNILPEPRPKELTKEEQDRVDGLLAAARGFHYSAFVVSGVSLVLASLEKVEGFLLPVGGIEIPNLQTIVGLYLLVLVLTYSAERLFDMASPWLQKDTRRPPFAWIALARLGDSRGSVLFWLVIPVVVCAVATAISLGQKDLTGTALSFVGIIFVLAPRSIETTWYLLTKRQDERGGPATFSIWLLYWYRLERGLMTTVFFFAPVIAVLPKWRDAVWRVASLLISISVAMLVLRMIGGSACVYRRIDRLGKRLGFPLVSKHYK